MSSSGDNTSDADGSSYSAETLQESFDARTAQLDDTVAAVLQDAQSVYIMKMPLPGDHAISEQGDTSYVHTDALTVEELPTDEELPGLKARNLYDQLKEGNVYDLKQADKTRVTFRDDLSEPVAEFTASFYYTGTGDSDVEGYLSFEGELIGEDAISRYAGLPDQ